jgi:hypothetical protein
MNQPHGGLAIDPLKMLGLAVGEVEKMRRR